MRYIACGKPAKAIVRHRNGETYCMCAACAEHNVKNRNGKYVQKGETYKLTPIDPAPVPLPGTPSAIAFEADSPVSNPTNRVAAMVQTMRDAQAECDRLTDALKKASALYQSIELEDLPELMRELGITSVGLGDGTKVEIIEDLKCGISAANRERAHEWIRKRGDGGIIKTKLGIEFDRDEDEIAEKTAEQIRELTHRDVEISEGIHPQTLKAYLKERREAGDNVPADLFGLYPFQRAKLSNKKRN